MNRQCYLRKRSEESKVDDLHRCVHCLSLPVKGLHQQQLRLLCMQLQQRAGREKFAFVVSYQELSSHSLSLSRFL